MKEGKDIEENEDESENEENLKKKALQDLESKDNEVERQNNVIQQISLKKHIFSRKLRISTLIFILSMALCSFYFGTYLVASTIYSEALEDF